MTIHEAELDHAFADAIAVQPLFREWLIKDGRFGRLSDQPTLLMEEQRLARSTAKHWWKHWWCRLSDGTESETDIFLVFKAGDTRFALHIENKPAHGSLAMRQASDYRRRAAFMANEKRWLNYSDFETLLIAPRSFLAINSGCVAQFDRAVEYEEIARFVPMFAEAAAGFSAGSSGGR